MGILLRPIVPKKPILARGLAQKVEAELKAWGGDSINDLTAYPPQSSTTYRRTGTLGRNWRLRFGTENQTLVATVSNQTDYAVYVQGPLKGAKGDRQTERMASKGWCSVQTVGRNQWRKYGGRIKTLLESAGSKSA